MMHLADAQTAKPQEATSTIQSGGSSGRLRVGFALVIILAVGVGPFLYQLQTWPMTLDAALWIRRGAPTNPDWHHWVFARQHFKGYRPLTAVSYTLNYSMGAFSPLAYRVTDLILHGLSGLFVFLLYRRLAPALPRWGGLLAAALFMAHPVMDQVVPYIARRSYSMATLFTLAGLCVLCPNVGERGSDARLRSVILRSFFGTLLLGCALLSNETSFVAVPMVPIFVLHCVWSRRDRWGSLLAHCAIPMVVALGVFVLRFCVIGGLGGYPSHGHAAERIVPIIRATWGVLSMVTPIYDIPELQAPTLLLVCGVLVGGYYLWRGVINPILRFGRPQARLPGVLTLWLVGFTFFFAPQGVWFPRQVYPVVAPFALLVGVVVASAVNRHRHEPLILGAHLAAPLLLAGWIMAQSPLVLGPDPMRAEAWKKTDQMLRDLHVALDDVPEPAVVRLAMPYYKLPDVYALRPTRLGDREVKEKHSGSIKSGNRRSTLTPFAEVWMQTLLGARKIRIDPLIRFEQHPIDDPITLPRYVRSHNRPTLEVPRRYEYQIQMSGAKLRTSKDATILWLDIPRGRPGRYLYVYFHDGKQGRLIPIGNG